jgi:hypothetical protein
MTKQNMITDIQAKEAALWLELAVYDHRNAPINCTPEQQICWDCTDTGHLKLMHAWNAVNELMESLGIEADFDSSDHSAASMLRSDLFRRRQEARGIYYN